MEPDGTVGDELHPRGYLGDCFCLDVFLNIDRVRSLRGVLRKLDEYVRLGAEEDAAALVFKIESDFVP